MNQDTTVTPVATTSNNPIINPSSLPGSDRADCSPEMTKGLVGATTISALLNVVLIVILVLSLLATRRKTAELKTHPDSQQEQQQDVVEQQDVELQQNQAYINLPLSTDDGYSIASPTEGGGGPTSPKRPESGYDYILPLPLSQHRRYS